MNGGRAYVPDALSTQIGAAAIKAEICARALRPGELTLTDIRSLESSRLRARTIDALIGSVLSQARALEAVGADRNGEVE